MMDQRRHTVKNRCAFDAKIVVRSSLFISVRPLYLDVGWYQEPFSMGSHLDSWDLLRVSEPDTIRFGFLDSVLQIVQLYIHCRVGYMLLRMNPARGALLAPVASRRSVKVPSESEKACKLLTELRLSSCSVNE